MSADVCDAAALDSASLHRCHRVLFDLEARPRPWEGGIGLLLRALDATPHWRLEWRTLELSHVQLSSHSLRRLAEAITSACPAVLNRKNY